MSSRTGGGHENKRLSERALSMTDFSSICTPNPTISGVCIETGFDNSNPRQTASIEIASDGTVTVRQYLEHLAPRGYSFHLHMAFINESAAAQTVPVRILWAEKDFDSCHDYMYVGYDSGKDWRMLATSCLKGVTQLELVLPKGRHLLCCSPKFDYGDYLALLDRYEKQATFTRLVAAKTPEDRTISCLRCGKPGGKKIVVTTRAHGYETAGAYCMAGWLEAVTGSVDAHASVLGSLDIFLFPMIGVDAVGHGHCCLAPSSVNFGRELAFGRHRDSGAKGLAEFIFDLKPDFYLDMHNNTGPHLCDAFRSTSGRMLEAFAAVAPDRARDQKTWGIRKMEFPEGYMLTACEQRFGTVPLLTEFPWYTRLPRDMAEHGRLFFDVLFSIIAGW